MYRIVEEHHNTGKTNFLREVATLREFAELVVEWDSERDRYERVDGKLYRISDIMFNDESGESTITGSPLVDPSEPADMYSHNDDFTYRAIEIEDVADVPGIDEASEDHGRVFVIQGQIMTAYRDGETWRCEEEFFGSEDPQNYIDDLDSLKQRFVDLGWMSNSDRIRVEKE